MIVNDKVSCYYKGCVPGCQNICSLLNECVFNHELVKDEREKLLHQITTRKKGRVSRVILKFFEKKSPPRVSHEQMQKDFVESILERYGYPRQESPTKSDIEIISGESLTDFINRISKK